MKKFAVSLIFMAVLLATIPAFCGDPGEPEPRKEKWKLIKFHRLSDDATWLDLKNGGYFFAAFVPAKILGVRKVEVDGFRFIPAMEAPKGLPKEAFDKFYGFSPLIKEIFIPYSAMKSVKFHYGITIRTKDGKKYHFRIEKNPRKIAREIRSHL